MGTLGIGSDGAGAGLTASPGAAEAGLKPNAAHANNAQSAALERKVVTGPQSMHVRDARTTAETDQDVAFMFDISERTARRLRGIERRHVLGASLRGFARPSPRLTTAFSIHP